MRYDSLSRYLGACVTRSVRLSFGDIERILGGGLPASARRHQAWWSNTDTHSHAQSWMKRGWRTRDLDLAAESIMFEREGVTGVSESPSAPFRHVSAARPDLVTFDRAKLNVAARRILDDYTSELGGDVQAALDKALTEARIAFRKRLMASIPRGTPSTVSSVDLIREDRDAR